VETGLLRHAHRCELRRDRELALNGLTAYWRLFVLLATFAIMAVGFLGLASLQDDLPLWLRCRKWALREVERMGKDPSHPLHKAYFASSAGYKDVSDWEHKRALDAVHALYERAHLGRWKHSRPGSKKES
jgi:hypothetical protein